MKRIFLPLLAAILVSALPQAATAKEMLYEPLRAVPAQLDKDRAYVLVRVSTAKSGLASIESVLMRIPQEEELAEYYAAKKAAYETALAKRAKTNSSDSIPSLEEFDFTYSKISNIFSIPAGKFLEDGEMRTILLSVPPGDYVLYGVATGDTLAVCNCLGTLQFKAEAGIITDMGALYADKVHKDSPLPYVEDNLGPSMGAYLFVFGQALVPASETPPPAILNGLPIKSATYEVVGQFYEPGVALINRLAPVPGILAYERGRPVDVRSRQ